MQNFTAPQAPAPAVDPRKQGIAQSWTLREFRDMTGKMGIAPFVRKSTGEPFRSLVFHAPQGTVFVAFSEAVGELTPDQLQQGQDYYCVHQMAQSGKFVLGKPGSQGLFAGEVEVL